MVMQNCWGFTSLLMKYSSLIHTIKRETEYIVVTSGIVSGSGDVCFRIRIAFAIGFLTS